MADKSGCLLSLRVLMRSLKQRTFYLKKRYEEEVYRVAHKAFPTKKKDRAQHINLLHESYNKTGTHSNGVAPWLLFYSIVSGVSPTERTTVGCILIQVHGVFYYQAMNLDGVSGKFLIWTQRVLQVTAQPRSQCTCKVFTFI